jgi:Flp pilus assembly protein CpaB
MNYGISEPFTFRRQDSSPGAAKRRKSQARSLNVLIVITIFCLLGSALYRFVTTLPAPKMTKVVAAASDIPVGCKLGFRQLHYLEMPVKYASPDMARSMEELVGRINRRFLAAGEPIKGNDLLPTRQRLATSVGSSERGITLSLPSDCLVDNGLVPGDRVDVIAMTTRNNHDYAVTLCQNVAVIVCDAKEMMLGSRSRPGDPKVVTISASEADCEKLSLAAGRGAKLRLILRNPGMKEVICSRGADDDDLVPPRARGGGGGGQVCVSSGPPLPPGLRTAPGLLAPPPPANEGVAPEAPGWTVEIIRGTSREIQKF